MLLYMVWLADNDLGAEGAAALIPGLQSLPGLTSLDISREWDRAAGGAAMAHAVAYDVVCRQRLGS